MTHSIAFGNYEYDHARHNSLELFEKLTSSLDNGHQKDVVVMDFTKVFSRVNRSLLRHKLDLYGVQNPFLHGKRQAVVINCAVSDFIPITSSVPQGSVLGPCLFLVYINDLSSRMMSLTYKTLQNDLQRLEQ